MKYYAIIVAGGSGSRMQTDIAKQFLLLNGRPVLMHTMDAFYNCALNIELLVVLNIHQHQYWEELCIAHHFNIPHQLIKGGEQRFHSVKNGLKAIKGKGIVAVHDAVRPLVSTALIFNSFKIAEEKGTAIASIHPVDSVRRMVSDDKSESISRNALVMIQTPQTFDTTILKKAYQQPYRNEFTDDASVAEQAGFEIHLIPGERDNIKITYPEDLDIATVLIQKDKLYH